MRNHRLCVAALAVALLGIVPNALAQSVTTDALDPDGLTWDIVDEDCGALLEGRSDAAVEAPTTPEEPTEVAPPRRRRRHDDDARAATRTESASVTTHAPSAHDEPAPTPSSVTTTTTATRPPAPGPSEPVTGSRDSSHDGTLPRGRSVGRLTVAACEAVLRSERVPFTREPSDGATTAIEQPIRLGGPLRGITIRPHGGDEASIHSIIDCRLAVALLGWADELREAGFVAIEHVSIFRPGARVARSHRPSGHSHALALDALRFVRSDGTFFSVLDHWSARVRGTDPCGTYDEPSESSTVRRLVCSAVASETFQVVITPHHDDAHANHVHLEIVPGVDWTVAR